VSIHGTPEEWLAWLTDRDDQKRKEATLILGGLRPSDRLRLAPLIAALKSTDDNVVFWSVIALGCLRSRARRAIPAVVDLVHHRDFGMRQAAIHTLSVLGPNDPRVKREIIQALRDPNPYVRREALQSLINMKNLTEDDIAVIKSAGSDPDDAVASWSEIALRNIRLKQIRNRGRA
jgi:HEAT repeat protein